MPHVEASNGIEVLNQLTENDSWIKTTYFLAEEASRQLGNPAFLEMLSRWHQNSSKTCCCVCLLRVIVYARFPQSKQEIEKD